MKTDCPLLFSTEQNVKFALLCVFSCAASEAMRGSTPLDVAASSVMDNNGLALALEEPDLEKVCHCGPLLKNTFDCREMQQLWKKKFVSKDASQLCYNLDIRQCTH